MFLLPFCLHFGWPLFFGGGAPWAPKVGFSREATIVVVLGGVNPKDKDQKTEEEATGEEEKEEEEEQNKKKKT